jgi:formiminotetrahydrofolate cyclodeaminase
MLNEQPLGELLAALGARTPAPASGAAAALTGALAAALTELAARFANDDAAASRAQAIVHRLVGLADDDGAAYSAFMAERNEVTRARIIEIPTEIAVLSDEAADLAQTMRSRLTTSVVGDAEAAVELAHAAARVARRLAQLNA